MVRLAIIGTGAMANVHAQEFAKIKGCRLVAGCDIDAGRIAEFAERNAIEPYTDAAALLAREDIDAISVVAADAAHSALSLQAIAAGKHVLCEKPLALNAHDASAMAAAAAEKGVINMVNLSYRNSPAIQKAHEIIASGQFGRPIQAEASYLQSWLSSKCWGDWREHERWLWRLSTRHGSMGVLGDVGVHIVDFISFPVGEIRTVSARLKTFAEIKGREHAGYPLDANDSALLTVEFANGALGAISTTRWATGYKNRLWLQVHCERGALRIDLDKGYSRLELCQGADVDTAEWKSLDCGKTPSIYERFIKSIRTGKNDQPDFARGAAVQKVLDACFESDALGRAVEV